MYPKNFLSQITKQNMCSQFKFTSTSIGCGYIKKNSIQSSQGLACPSTTKLFSYQRALQWWLAITIIVWTSENLLRKRQQISNWNF